ncbi:hypothetical protein [Pedobacter immunditicola]|uniref:hypothetical protein n=1 Tax=Pedobacter immunditicola TaxID=3133440 RepID=UPI0030A1EFB1
MIDAIRARHAGFIPATNLKNNNLIMKPSQFITIKDKLYPNENESILDELSMWHVSTFLQKKVDTTYIHGTSTLDPISAHDIFTTIK